MTDRLAGREGVRRYTQDDVDDLFEGQNVCGRLLEMGDGQQVCILLPGHDDGEHGFNRKGEPPAMREIFEPHEGRMVMVRHTDGMVRLWWKAHGRWNSNTSWFGWSWPEVVKTAEMMRLSPHQSEWPLRVVQRPPFRLRRSVMADSNWLQHRHADGSDHPGSSCGGCTATPFAMPDRIAVDAKGYGWRVWDDEDYWSMVPTNPDNSPIPEPLTWFVPRGNYMKVTGVHWCIRHHRMASACSPPANPDDECVLRQVFFEKEQG